MSLSTLAPDVAYMSEQEDMLFNGVTEAERREKYAASAKADLTDDLQEALHLDPNDASDLSVLDTIVDDHEGRLQRTLSVLHIIYWLQNRSGGLSSAFNVEKLDYWRSEYRRLRKGFPGLRSSRGSTTVTSTIIAK